eukprot:73819_1
MGNKLLKLDCLTLSRNIENEYTREQSISSKSRPETPKPELTDNKIHRSHIKVLFLGVDGVLNTTNTQWNDKTNGIEDNLLSNLKLILDSTDCKIVLSTSWRLHANYKHILLYQLETRGNININELIIGDTQHIPNCTRSTEIMRFIHTYNSNPLNKYYISQFSAIDHLPLNTYPNSSFIKPHFVKTNHNIGISTNNVDKCIQILTNNEDDYYAERFTKKYTNQII